LPQASLGTDPDLARPVFIEGHHPTTKPAVVAEALNLRLANHTEPGGGRTDPAGPDSAFSILEKPVNGLLGQLRKLSQLGAVPTRESIEGADPERSVACDEQADDIAGWKMLTRRRRPRGGPDTVEASQAEFCSQPQISIRRL